MNTIYLAATDKHIPARAYIAGYKLAKANLQETFRHGLCTWWPVTGAQIVREYRRDMHARINVRGGQAWRNEETIRERDYYHDAREANSRCIVRQFRVRKLNKRLAHRLTHPWEA